MKNTSLRPAYVAHHEPVSKKQASEQVSEQASEQASKQLKRLDMRTSELKNQTEVKLHRKQQRHVRRKTLRDTENRMISERNLISKKVDQENEVSWHVMEKHTRVHT